MLHGKQKQEKIVQTKPNLLCMLVRLGWVNSISGGKLVPSLKKVKSFFINKRKTKNKFKMILLEKSKKKVPLFNKWFRSEVVYQTKKFDLLSFLT